jgi:hypothetical protein
MTLCTHRIEDALHATRAPVEEGVVPGGGVAPIRAQKSLEKLEGANEDQTVGIRILSRSARSAIQRTPTPPRSAPRKCSPPPWGPITRRRGLR